MYRVIPSGSIVPTASLALTASFTTNATNASQVFVIDGLSGTDYYIPIFVQNTEGGNTSLYANGPGYNTNTSTLTATNFSGTAVAALTALTAAANAILATSFTALYVATGVGVILLIVGAIVALQLKFNILGDAVTGVKIAAEFLWNKIKEGFGWVVSNWPLLLAILAGPFGLAILAVVKFKDQIIGIFKSIIGFTVDTFKSIASAIYEPFKTVFNGIAELWNSTVGALGFTVPNWVPLGLGGKSFEVPDIPTLGEGGIVTGPTLALIGESGPEAVIPLNGSGGGMSGNTINVTVTSADPNAVVAALQRYVRMSGPVPLNTRTM